MINFRVLVFRITENISSDLVMCVRLSDSSCVRRFGICRVFQVFCQVYILLLYERMISSSTVLFNKNPVSWQKLTAHFGRYQEHSQQYKSFKSISISLCSIITHLPSWEQKNNDPNTEKDRTIDFLQILNSPPRFASWNRHWIPGPKIQNSLSKSGEINCM